MTPEVSLIVPTRDRAHLLRQSLPRLCRQSEPAGSFEVVAIDDGSADETRAVLASLAAQGLVWRSIPHAGAAAARNAAIALARGSLLVFVDDDVFVRDDFVASHRRAHVAKRDSIVTGPIVTVEAVPDAMPGNRTWRRYHRAPFPTCNVSVPREDVLALGGFDERFSEYGWEDVELGLRLRRRGLRRRFAWDAPAFHLKTRAQQRSLAYRIPIEEQRGRMGALLYSLHPTAGIGAVTKMSPAIRAVDAVLDRLLNLDRAVARVRAGDHRVRTPRWRHRLLLLHAEVAAGRHALRDRSRSPRAPRLWSLDRAE